MPLYEYVCLGCEERFETRHAFDAPEPECPSCGGDRARRQFSVFASPAGERGSTATASACACGGACACGAH